MINRFTFADLAKWVSLSDQTTANWGAWPAILIGFVGSLIAGIPTHALLIEFQAATGYEFSRLVSGQLIALSGFIPVALYLRSRKLNISDSLLLGGLNLKQLLKPVTVAIAVYVLLSVVGLTILALVLPEALEVKQDVALQAGASPQTLIVGFISLVIITPVLEEVLFRGFIFRGLAKSTNFWLAAIVSSLLFALVHAQLALGVDTLMLGVVSCALVARSSSLWPSIILHALKNGLAFYLLFIEPLF